MSRTRRQFLEASARLAGALGGAWASPLAALAASPAPAPRPLRLLILGGTGFIGPHEVRYALARGHHVTLFNRGKTNPGLFPDGPQLETLLGDRATRPGSYAALRGRTWDAVIDNPTTYPRWVREAAAALHGQVPRYVFISTVSVYASNATPGDDETAALLTTETPDDETPEHRLRLYGPLKVLAEREAEKAFGGMVTILRPGLIVGAGDPTNRFSYWPVRLARGGEVLAPPPDDPVQLIDARDLAEWTIRCVEQKTTGVFNATGPATRLSVGRMLATIRDTLAAPATFTHVSAAFLREQHVSGWTDLPVWVEQDGDDRGFTQRSNARALAHGLTFRPLADTVRQTLAFYREQPAERQQALRAGLESERERQVLAAWRARRG